MQFMTRLIALTRAMQLRRQFREIDKTIEQMPSATHRKLAGLAMREFAVAAKSEFPHLYATPPEDKYCPWGAGTSIGMERVRSDNLQVKLRGLALWLSVVYYETKDSAFPEQQLLHRQVVRSLRVLKEALPQEKSPMEMWPVGEQVRAA